MPDYFDRFIRDENHLRKAIEYIEQNPVKAGLVNEARLWEWSSAADAIRAAGGTPALPGMWQGTHGLAEDVRYYGRKIREQAQEKIGHLYPKAKLPKELGGGDANVIAWLWARTVKCSNPACGARMPLIRSFWLAKKKPVFIHAHPVLDHRNKTVRFEIRDTGEPVKETTTGKGARCLFCDNFIKKPELRDLASEHGVQEIPLAVVADGPRGRVYLPSTALEIPKVKRPDAGQVEQPMTDDRRWFSPPLYGLPNFSDIFTPRQLSALVTLSDLVKANRAEVLKDARAAGLSDADTANYADAVTIFLALAVDRCADFNCGLSTWKPSGQQQMHLFTRQAIPMAWDFAEANILGQKAICWHNAVELTAGALEPVIVGPSPVGHSAQVDAAGGAKGKGSLLSAPTRHTTTTSPMRR
jgi:putative DNA methylase